MSGRALPAELKKQMQRAVIRYSDMPSDMMTEIVDTVVGAIDKFQNSGEPDLEASSRAIKDILDKQYGLQWHVAIGRGFSFDVSAQNGSLLHFFYQGDLGILIYKC